jgi:uncharacterized protein (TIGR02147 family)
MPTIYEYTDYRKYLRDFHAAQKAKNQWFSYQLMAKKAGLHSKSYIAEIINGRKNLSKEGIFRIARACNINGKAFAYFELLVAFNQAETAEQRNHFLTKLTEFNRRSCTTQRLVDRYEFYAQWYHNTVRELVTIKDFGENYALLAKSIKPAITPGQARESVQLLLRLGLIKKNGSKYIQTDTHITTGDEVRNAAVARFHLQNLQLAAEAIDRCDPDDRDISCIVAGLSPTGISKVKSEIQQFRQRLVEIINSDKTPARAVYHINFQMYQTSEFNE